MIKRNQRGQTIVLGVLTALLITVCMFMTISVAWQVRSRIQLQHAADARAFSDATMVARAYNTFAYSNRAMVGNIVAMTILHAYHSEVSAAADLYFATIPVYTLAMAAEIAAGTVCFGIFGCYCIKLNHCVVHNLKLLLDSLKALMAWIGDSMGGKISNTDADFVEAINAINASNKTISLLQKGLQGAIAAIGAPGDFAGGDDQMNKWNMYNGQSKGASCSLALMGVELLGAPSLENSVPACKVNIESQEENRKTEITEIVNASRPHWIRNRMRLAVAPLMMLPAATQALKEELDYWVYGVVAQIPGTGGATAFYEDPPSGALPLVGSLLGSSGGSNQKGKSIASFDHYRLAVGGVDAGCFWPLLPSLKASPLLGPIGPAKVESNAQGGAHNGWGFTMGLNDVHGSRDHKLEMKDIFNMVVYDSDSAEDDGYRQPTIVSSFMVDSLSVTPEETNSSAPNPWDLKFKIKLDINETSVDLRNQDQAKAVSKALTYYHHPGNWKEPPNFWSPFWRAKLHPVGLNLTDAADVATVGAVEALAGTDLESISF